MAEPTVPMSDAERRVRAWLDAREGLDGDAERERPILVTNGVPLYQSDLRALLSQPTPTAEKVTLDQRAVQAFGPGVLERTGPPDIADMVPGTTFVGTTRDTNYTSRWTRVADGLMSGMGIPHDIAEINPSTIRDVRPPKEQP